MQMWTTILKRLSILLFVINISTVSAQINSSKFLKKVQDDFEHYDSTMVRESVYLHIGKNSFRPGETLWIKAYLTNFSNQPIFLNRNLYVDFIRPDGEIVQQKLIYIDNNGEGNGYFNLADSLTGGYYFLRAYTASQRNFNPNYIFSKPIEIINSEVPFYSPEYVKLLRKQKRKRRHARLNTNFNGSVLLANTKNTLQIQTTNYKRFPEQADITIQDISNKRELKIKTNPNGYASIEIAAGIKSQYQITAETTSGKIKVTTAIAKAQGIKIQSVSENKNSFSVSIQNKLPTTKDKHARSFILLCRIPGATLASKIFYQGNKTSSNVVLPKTKNCNGLLSFLLLDVNGKIVSSHSYFKETSPQKLEVKSVYKNDSVFVSIADKRIDRLSAFVIADDRKTTHQFPQKIGNYSLMNNRTSQFLNLHNEGFNTKNFAGNKANVWQRIYNFKEKDKEEIIPPESSIFISGRLMHSLLNIPVKKEKIELSILNKHFDIYESQTDDKGYFWFGNLNYTDTILIQINAKNSQGKKAFNIEVYEERPLKFSLYFPNVSAKTLIKQARKGRGEYNNTLQYTDSRKAKESTDKIHSRADRVLDFNKINTDAYQSTLKVLESYVHGLRASGMSSLRGPTSLTQSTEPLYLINGIPVGKSAVYNLPPNDVDYVEILKSGANTAIYGSRGGNGVVAVYTKQGHHTTPGELNLSIMGYTQMIPFKQSGIKSETSQDIIFFAPELTKNEEGIYQFSFPTPKTKKQLFIDFQGFSDKNKIIDYRMK
ncbi:MAG: TonB-dependent receptor plug domain-containing protein, partial [Bacteroidota bacterium]|nr:TonB-dependent receptor plug domain-containing protein [Bacteroidota bacterium]